MQLTDQQILIVEKRLQETGLQYQALQEELLDHICCAIEDKLTEGYPFQDAQSVVFQAFGKNGIKELEQQTIHLLNQKSLIMKRLLLVTLCFLLLSVTVLLAIPQDPPSGNPLGNTYKITSTFGMRLHPILKKKKMHKGIDFAAPHGTPVLATADGEVLKIVEKTKGYGKFIIIKHDDQYETLYAQLSSIKVQEGDSITKGAVIGLVGSSGSSIAPHLHYEVRKNGEVIDPSGFLN